MAWLCLKDNALAGSQMYIVTGPRIDLSIVLIDRMKNCYLLQLQQQLVVVVTLVSVASAVIAAAASKVL
jgi:hypothetical protein